MNARPRSRRVLATGGAALLAALLPLLGGCGIRTTTVPVDAGPAPSRVSCQVPKAVNSPGVTDAAVVGIYLVCGMQATPVPRTVSVRPQARGRVEQVRELVAQLNRALTAQEAAAGFTTAVPATLEILGPWPGDPADALRLDAVVEDLPSFALAQIVCTIAQSSLASPGHSVVLGGSTKGSTVRSYTCTPELRTRPEAAESAGTEVSS